MWRHLQIYLLIFQWHGPAIKPMPHTTLTNHLSRNDTKQRNWVNYGSSFRSSSTKKLQLLFFHRILYHFQLWIEFKAFNQNTIHSIQQLLFDIIYYVWVLKRSDHFSVLFSVGQLIKLFFAWKSSFVLSWNKSSFIQIPQKKLVFAFNLMASIVFGW